MGSMQDRILDVLRETGRPMTYREIRDAIDGSSARNVSGNVSNSMRGLIRYGFIVQVGTRPGVGFGKDGVPEWALAEADR